MILNCIQSLYFDRRYYTHLHIYLHILCITHTLIYTGDTPRKNIDVMSSVSNNLKTIAANAEKQIAKNSKKSKRSSSEEDEAANAEDDEDVVADKKKRHN